MTLCGAQKDDAVSLKEAERSALNNRLGHRASANHLSWNCMRTEPLATTIRIELNYADCFRGLPALRSIGRRRPDLESKSGFFRACGPHLPFSGKEDRHPD